MNDAFEEMWSFIDDQWKRHCKEMNFPDPLDESILAAADETLKQVTGTIYYETGNGRNYGQIRPRDRMDRKYQGRYMSHSGQTRESGFTRISYEKFRERYLRERMKRKKESFKKQFRNLLWKEWAYPV